MAKRYHGARNANREGDGEDRISNSPFLNVEVDYRIAHESEVTYVEKFHCSLNESVVSIDSDFLVNFGWAMNNIRPLFENKMSRIHPLFMKESICQIKDADIEMVNTDESISYLIHEFYQRHPS